MSSEGDITEEKEDSGGGAREEVDPKTPKNGDEEKKKNKKKKKKKKKVVEVEDEVNGTITDKMYENFLKDKKNMRKEISEWGEKVGVLAMEIVELRQFLESELDEISSK